MQQNNAEGALKNISEFLTLIVNWLLIATILGDLVILLKLRKIGEGLNFRSRYLMSQKKYGTTLNVIKLVLSAFYFLLFMNDPPWVFIYLIGIYFLAVFHLALRMIIGKAKFR
jgi:hypothetical protein